MIDMSLRFLFNRVRDELLPNLDDVRQNEEWNWYDDFSPEDWMYSLKQFLHALRSYFHDDQNIVNDVNEQLSMVEIWIDEHTEYEQSRQERLIGRVDVPIVTHSTRIIFDDVDVD